MKIYIRDDSKISDFKETWLKRDLGFQCLNPPIELTLRDRGYLKIKQTDTQEAQGLNSQFKYFEFVSFLIKDEDDFNVYRQLPI